MLAVLSRMRLDTFGEDDPVGVSALVGLQHGDEQKVYFLVPVAGGETLVQDGTTIRTLTPGSPLGQALEGGCVGEDIELKIAGRRLLSTIDWIS